MLMFDNERESEPILLDSPGINIMIECQVTSLNGHNIHIDFGDILVFVISYFWQLLDVGGKINRLLTPFGLNEDFLSPTTVTNIYHLKCFAVKYFWLKNLFRKCSTRPQIEFWKRYRSLLFMWSFFKWTILDYWWISWKKTG